MITDNSTVREVKQFLSENVKKGTICPCCHQSVKVYPYPFNRNQARDLIRLYLLDRKESRFYHIKSEIHKSSEDSSGEFAKIRYWGLIEQMTKDPNDTKKRTSGYWRITPKGRAFVEREIPIQEKARIYNKKCYGTMGDNVFIDKTLGTFFDYEKLMNNPV